jgi:hypothetical protein
MKKHTMDIMFYGSMLVLIAISYKMNTKAIGVLAIIVALTSLYITTKHFKLKSTLNKIQSLTLNPDAARHVAMVLAFINKTKAPGSDVSITRESIEIDPDLFASVIYLLGFGDDVAMAIDKNLVNKRLVKDMLGDLLVRVGRDMIPYINEVRDEKGDVYTALLAMCERWNDD